MYTKTFTGCVVAPDGVERWFINGAYGRADDLPSVIHPDGKRLWYIENPKRGGFGQFPALLHREGGPAVIAADGSEFWYLNGKLHRPEEDGPAITLADGTRKWYLAGEMVRAELPEQAEPAV